MTSETEQRLIETLEDSGSVIIHDSGTIHLTMECHHVDKWNLGGPNDFEYDFRNVQAENLLKALQNPYPNEESLCSNCDKKWGLNGELV